MKFYVGGKWSEKEFIRSLMDRLEQLGHTSTHDWTKYEANPENKLADCAFKDIQGVQQADVVLAYFSDPKYAYRGTFTELGAGLALGKRVVVITANVGPADPNPYYMTNCFFHHPIIERFDSFDDFLASI